MHTNRGGGGSRKSDFLLKNRPEPNLKKGGGLGLGGVKGVYQSISPTRGATKNRGCAAQKNITRKIFHNWCACVKKHP